MDRMGETVPTLGLGSGPKERTLVGSGGDVNKVCMGFCASLATGLISRV